MATIYKITNNISGLYYIGKTIRPVQVRWKEHLHDFECYKSEGRTSIPLYNAFNKDGIKNFSFQVIETDIPNEQINQKEKYYINLYDSKVHHKGYNITEGGDGGRVWSKLTEDQVNEIINILKDDNNLMSFTDIAKNYNISVRVIISINNGESWYKQIFNYPLRRYDVTGLTISKQQYQKIILDIKNNKLLLKDIQNKYNLSEDQVTSINQGKYCYNGQHPYYKDIYSGPFPIRPISNKSIQKDNFAQIFYDVLFTKDSMAKIGEKYNIKGNTLQCIISGKRRLELTKNYIIPMRKNIKENQKIFLTLHPEFLGGDATCATRV